MSKRQRFVAFLSFIAILSGPTAVAHAWDDLMCIAPAAPEQGVALETLSCVSEAVALRPLRYAQISTPLDSAQRPVLPPRDAHPRLAARSLPGHEAARQTYAALGEQLSRGEFARARVSLASMRATLPELADRWVLHLAELDALEAASLAAGEAPTAPPLDCDALDDALESPLPSISARARVERVRCLLSSDDSRGITELRTLRARYPELPDALELELLAAQRKEARGDLRGAAAAYRWLDLLEPGSPQAELARERLDAMEESGETIRPWTLLQETERADRLVHSGPPGLARTTLDSLLARERLPSATRGQLLVLRARLYRVEGRFDQAASALREARGADAESLSEDDAARASDLEAAARSREMESARADLRRLHGGRRRLSDVQTFRLFSMVRIAARAALHEELAEVLEALAERSLPCGMRVEAAVLGAGSGADEGVAALLAACVDAPGGIGVSARYHRARALDRLGQSAEARAELRRVIADDTGTRFYALWARQALAQGAVATTETTRPLDESDVLEVGAGKIGELESDRSHTVRTPLLPMMERPSPLLPPEDDAADGGGSEEDELGVDLLRDDDVPDPPSDPMQAEEIEAALSSLIEEHGEAFPWFARALTLYRMGDDQAAADELHAAFLANFEARGRGPLRAGIEAVYRGAAPGRMRIPSAAIWRARRGLSGADRTTLADISEALGDHGLAIRFGGPGRAAQRPLAFESFVRAAAARHDLDPYLLLAVMRVESVYSPRIVSYAGAIGLMQIMPRTGRLIAHATGRDGFTTADLLDPETNVEMAAWYLRSLVDRMEGRWPLAIASYNGGPHNVRRWMEEYSRSMPLPAFLERIPFDQTHRYVRRVMSHWAAYRTRAGLPMMELDESLPGAAHDDVAF